jgi:uncharacterized membrane protein
MNNPPETPPVNLPASDVSSEDRLWVLLCFFFTPIIPLITLFLEDKKNKPFVKYHTVPTLILGIAEIIAAGILAFIPIVVCLTPFMWIINLVLGLRANKGVNVDIPVITKFARQQGW